MANKQTKQEELNAVEQFEQEIDMHISHELAKMRHGEESFHSKYEKILKKKEEKLAKKDDK